MTMRNSQRNWVVLIFLAISFGLWESVALSGESSETGPRAITVEAARSYAVAPQAKLQIGFRYQQIGEWDQAQRMYEEVLWETRDPEDLTAVRELMVRLEEERVNRKPASPARLGRKPGRAAIPPMRPPQSAEGLQTPTLAQAGRPFLSWLETSVPVFVEMTAQRLARYMEAVGEKELTRECTEAEFRQVVVRPLSGRFGKEISDLSATIQPNGIVGAGTLHLGRLAFRVASRIGIALADGRPRAVLYEAKIGTLQVPEPVLKFLEKKINRLIARKLLPLKIKRVDFRQGKAFVSVEIA